MQGCARLSEKLDDVIIVACPGQGSQTPGFLSPWLEDSASAEFLGSVSENIGVDLVRHGTVSDADTIRDTAIAQPLIVAASLLAWRALAQHTALDAVGVAGHSVGEFAAAAAAGVLSEADALALVRVRGQAMAAAASHAETGMSAVVGGNEEQVLQKIAEHGLTAANRNGGGQIVAAGALGALTALAADAPRGARVITLQVAGAFHTEYMRSAIDPLEAAAQSVQTADPSHTLFTNADGSQVSNGAKYLRLLIDQVAQPVRWDACMQSFEADGISGFIELTPAGALTGIAKRALKGTPSVAIKSPADIDSAVALISDTAPSRQN